MARVLAILAAAVLAAAIVATVFGHGGGRAPRGPYGPRVVPSVSGGVVVYSTPVTPEVR